VDILSAIFLIMQDAGSGDGAPAFHDVAGEKCDARGDEIIKEKIASARPSAFAAGTQEMHQEVGEAEEQNDERLGPIVAQTSANPGARKLVEQGISSGGLVNCEIHPAARL